MARKPREPKSGDGCQYVQMKRSELTGHPRNPRTIDPIAARGLRESIRKSKGLVQPPVLNKTTGKLVAGHQRINQLDSLMGDKDYNITVAVIEVDEREEMALNIRLNSQAISGQYDLAELDSLIREFEFDLPDLGLDIVSLEQMHLDAGVPFDFDISPAEAAGQEIARQVADNVARVADEVDAEAEAAKIEEVKAAKAAFRERSAEMHDNGFNLLLTFPSTAAKVALLQHLGQRTDVERINGLHVSEALGVTEATDS